MKQFYLLILLAVSSMNGQIINIPDANFKNALVNTPCAYVDGEANWADVDTNDDGEIQVSEAEAVVELYIGNQDISSLVGITEFTGLYKLYCENNLLTSLSLTGMPFLSILDCSNNQLTSLTAHFNSPSDFDKELYCNDNLLSSMSISINGIYGLYELDASNNQFTDAAQFQGLPVNYLNVSNNPFVTFTGSGFYSIGLANCTLLTYCEIGGDYVFIADNPLLTHAKLSSYGVYNVHNNPLLQSVDIKDGVAAFIHPDLVTHFDLTDNPAMEFVCLDDLGQWYYEGEWFFQAETLFVTVDPGVVKTYYCSFEPGGSFNTVDGSVHFDCDGSNLPIMGGINLELHNDGDGIADAITYPGTSGNFSFFTTDSGTVNPAFENPYFFATPQSQEYSFAGAGGTQEMAFCISANGSHPDLEVTLIPVVPARPGFDADYKLVYRNKGTEIQSGSITFSYPDAQIDFVQANPMTSSQEDGSLSWVFVGLNPFETREVEVIFNVNSPTENPPVNIGDVLSFTASVDTDADVNASDNQYLLDQIVVGSFDPNDKAVSKTNISLAQLSDYLTYTIRFENTGTFYAENIAIRDLLSKNLDLSTLQFLAASHDLRMVLTPQNGGSDADKLEFFFKDIMLPATTDDPENSHGFVSYRIKPKQDLAMGSTIVNIAEIYFDFNAPIITNEVTTTLTELATTNFDSITFVLYPNPAGDAVNLSATSEIVSWSVCNSLGQMILRGTDVSKPIDVSGLDSGLYYMTVKTAVGSAVRKFVKY